MRIGMTLPVMEEDLDRDILRHWIERIDRGPWDSLAFGERINFPNPELMTLLGAAAAWTESVELLATICVLPMHNPIWAAKQFATIDMLCNGRLTVGVGLGGREEDYQAVGADFSTRKLRTMADGVATMRKIWAGEKLVEMAKRIVEPLPVQRGGPSVLVGAMGPKSIRSSAQYAHGICGMSFNAELDDIKNTFELTREAWKQQGREAPPRLITSFWVATGDGAQEQMNTHLRRYLNFFDPALVEQMLPSAGFTGSEQELKEFVAEVRALGADDLLLIPTTKAPEEVDRMAQLLF